MEIGIVKSTYKEMEAKARRDGFTAGGQPLLTCPGCGQRTFRYEPNNRWHICHRRECLTIRSDTKPSEGILWPWPKGHPFENRDWGY